MTITLRSVDRRLTMIVCALLLTTGCSTSERGSQRAGSPTTASASSSQGYTKEGQDMCALLTDEQVAQYLGGNIPKPERSSKHDRPTCTWEGNANQDVELKIWSPPMPSIITDHAERTASVGGYTGYIRTETAASCMIDIKGPERYLQLQVNWSETRSENDNFCDTVTNTAKDVIEALDW